MIVTGTRGLHGVERFILGSVARNVLLHAPCSVLVVRSNLHPHERPGRADPGRPLKLSPSAV